MEHTVKALFELQRFVRDLSLQRVINTVHARYASRELTLDEMTGLAAAGTPEVMDLKKGKKSR